MPELPEVETIVRAYRPRLEGRRITRFVSRWAKNAQPSVAAVRRGIVGKRIARLWRRAKYIVADLEDVQGVPGPRFTEHGQASLSVAPVDDRRRGHSTPRSGGHLLIHLRMSGRFEWAADHDGEPEHVRAYFDLDDGNRLLFCDARKFGKIVYTSDFEGAARHLGVEPLDRSFTVAALGRALSGHARQLKPLLLDQSVVAGLGNIYADESLFQARLHPTTRSDRLTGREVRELRTAIQAVLRRAIRHCGTSFDRAYLGGRMQRRLNVYGRTGLPCKRCKTPIEALRIAQRATHVCLNCQPLAGEL